MLLEIHDLSKSYRGRWGRGEGVRANDRIHLRAERGQVFGLLGHNGAGKTTLVNQVVGLSKPDAGTIALDGVDLVADPGHARRSCSLQPQAQLPIDGLTPRQAIELLGQLRGGRAAAVRARRERLVETLDIGAWLDTDGEKLSGGVKRLVSFAMAAVVPGRVVVLDEPQRCAPSPTRATPCFWSRTTSWRPSERSTDSPSSMPDGWWQRAPRPS